MEGMMYCISRNNKGHFFMVSTGWGHSNSLPQTGSKRGGGGSKSSPQNKHHSSIAKGPLKLQHCFTVALSAVQTHGILTSRAEAR